MFTLKHFIWIGICIILIVIMLILAKKLRFSLKTASLIMSIICIVSEVSKMMSDMMDNVDGGMSLDPKSLPFHLCSLMIFVVFYIYLAKDSPLKQTLINFLAVVGSIGSFCAIMIPTNGVRFDEIGPYQCFVFHGGLMWFSIYLLMFKHAKLDFKAYIKNLSILIFLAFMMIYINGALSAYGTNFFYVVRPPMDDLPILNLDHGWHVYFITLLLLGFILMTLFHLPFIIKSKKKSEEDK
ncbi:MAG: TIGR02206 family membrane protein [Bacilli bacterium]|nr:TIGR02206 family membrane protein [Bacilli bacterium]